MSEKELTIEEFKQLKRQQEKVVYEMLTEQTKKDMTDKAAFFELLDKVSKHVASSVSNIILVQAQKPEASAVMSISEWEKRNIHIPKDENGYYPKGIYQYAKDGYYTDSNGDVHDKFKIVKGYDATQTTSDTNYARSLINSANPITTFVNSSNAVVSRNIALVNSSPIKCLAYDKNKLISDKEDIAQGACYIPDTKTVIIRKLSIDSWFQTVAYEIAQGIYHKLEGGGYDRESNSFEAGITAYILCRMSAVPVELFMFNGFDDIKNRYTPEEFRSIINRCYDNAHDLAFRLNNKIRENNKVKASPIREYTV